MLRWGVIGCGRVSSDFTAALQHNGAQVVAVADYRIQDANTFADTFKIEHRFGSYDELAASTHVDVVYIGTIHPFHKNAAIACLKGGKHVLVEKPIALNAKDAAEIIAVAREKKLFLMEAMWTRLFPAVRQTVELLQSSAIGEVRLVQANIGFLANPSVSRFFDPKLGGGALLDIGSLV
eukprot:m.899181 g.899181  ORF g.899181 m.899181 type:complete len:179 (-) comp60030_c0_seq1:5808-6344(-)